MHKMTREKELSVVTLVGSAGNLLLLTFKFVAGIVAGSSAMMADAVHSLSDFLTDLIVLVFMRVSARPQDAGHAYGHGKFETLESPALVANAWHHRSDAFSSIGAAISNRIAIEAHVRLDGDMSLREAHDIVSGVEHKLRERFGSSTLVTLHMEPLHGD